jgi:hypothetical protein
LRIGKVLLERVFVPGHVRSLIAAE